MIQFYIYSSLPVIFVAVTSPFLTKNIKKNVWTNQVEHSKLNTFLRMEGSGLEYSMEDIISQGTKLTLWKRLYNSPLLIREGFKNSSSVNQWTNPLISGILPPTFHITSFSLVDQRYPIHPLKGNIHQLTRHGFFNPSLREGLKNSSLIDKCNCPKIFTPTTHQCLSGLLVD